MWEENKHPRDKSGQFTSKGNEGQGEKKEETKKITKETEIDEDYERSYGPAPDKEEDPEGYKKYMDSYSKWQNDNFDNDYDSDFDEWEKENPNFVAEIDETDFEKVEKNEKINGSKAKNPNRKDKYGNELVSDEAFKIGQKGVKAYVDFMKQYNDMDSLKRSRIFMGGLQNAVSKAITEAGFDPNYDLTYQDHNEIIGSVLGEEVDTAAYESGDSIGFTNREYTGYQPSSSQNQTEERKDNTPDELNKIFNDLTKKYNMSEDDYWKLVRTIEKMNKSFGNTDKKELPF